MESGVTEMYKRIVKDEKNRYVIETFDSIHDLLNICDKRECRIPDSIRNSRGDFYGCGSYDEARELLTHGTEKGLDVVKEKVKKLTRFNDEKKLVFKNDVVGFAPVVPNVLLGLPNSMINSCKKFKKGKIVELIVNLEFSGGTSHEKVLRWGADVMANIINLEKNGYRVRVYYLNSHSDYGWKDMYYMKLLVKSENQPLDIKRFMFPFTNVAMQRYFVFDWFERLSEAKSHGHNYGMPFCDYRKSEIERRLKPLKTENSYVLIFGENVNERFKQIREGQEGTENGNVRP